MKRLFLLLTAISIISCSADRVNSLEENLAYESLDSFFNKYAPIEQVFQVDSASVITASQGSIITIDSSKLVLNTGVNPTYPFTIKFTELYSISDIILAQKEIGRSVSVPLFSEGIANLTLWKDTTELGIKQGEQIQVDFVHHHGAIAPLKEYYGGAIGTGWTNFGQSVLSNSSHYTFYANNVGWLNACGKPSLNGVMSGLSITIPGSDISNVKAYVILKDYHGLIEYPGYFNIEGGLNIKVVCFAKDINLGYRWFEFDTDMSKNRSIIVDFQTVSETELLSNINSL